MCVVKMNRGYLNMVVKESHMERLTLKQNTKDLRMAAMWIIGRKSFQEILVSGNALKQESS